MTRVYPEPGEDVSYEYYDILDKEEWPERAYHQEDPVREVRVFKFPHAVFTVFMPLLTEEERERRMNELKEACVNLLLSRKE